MSKVLSHLTNDCGWPASRIHFFGFAQGGSVALESALLWWKKVLPDERRTKETEERANNPTFLGSIVSISGPPLLHHALSNKCPTPVLAFHRPRPSSSALSSGDLTSLRRFFSNVREVKLSGDGMPRSRDEWLPIMEFWSQRLSKRKVEGAYEVLGGMS